MKNKELIQLLETLRSNNIGVIAKAANTRNFSINRTTRNNIIKEVNECNIKIDELIDRIETYDK